VSEDEQQAPEGTRPPNVEDLLLICRSLNEQQARYIVVGGLAIFEHGFARMTENLDLLVDKRPENVARVKAALTCLPDRASLEVEDSDVLNYTVVRINDEITVDLMGSACGVDYEQAQSMINIREIRGVSIPFASPQLLWKTKQTCREKDALDRSFLRKWFADHGMEPPAG
jgi:hypothetical protein